MSRLWEVMRCQNRYMKELRRSCPGCPAGRRSHSGDFINLCKWSQWRNLVGDCGMEGIGV